MTFRRRLDDRLEPSDERKTIQIDRQTAGPTVAAS
jgi:hypothetical protein